MKERIWRLWCLLFGCVCAEDYPACERCGYHLYGGFVEDGKFYPLQRRWWKLKGVVLSLRRSCCVECGKRLPGKDRNNHFCSDECFYKNLPF